MQFEPDQQLDVGAGVGSRNWEIAGSAGAADSRPLAHVRDCYLGPALVAAHLLRFGHRIARLSDDS